MPASREDWKKRLNSNREERREFLDAAGPEDVPVLVGLAPQLDLEIRRHILYALGRIATPEAVAYITAALHRSAEPKAQRTAARALARAKEREAIPELGELLRSVEDVMVRRAIVDALGKIHDESALPYLSRTLVKDASREVRAVTAAALCGLPVDWKVKANAVLCFLEESGVPRSRVDAENILKAISPGTGTVAEGPFALTDYLFTRVLQGTEPKDRRTQAIVAELITGSVDRDMDLAGERLNVFQHAKKIPEEKLQMLRIQIGGETALDPILRTLKENLKQNFTDPINKLNLETQEQWRRTVLYSQIGFVVRMAMSLSIFVAGLVLLVYSGRELLFGNLQPERLWGPGVSFVSALGTMLLLIYTGPLKDIRRSMIDLGAASAAFIAYVHRVLQVSHTFSAYYLQQQMTFAENKRSCDLIDDAMRDTISMLEAQAEEQLRPAA